MSTHISLPALAISLPTLRATGHGWSQPLIHVPLPCPPTFPQRTVLEGNWPPNLPRNVTVQVSLVALCVGGWVGGVGELLGLDSLPARRRRLSRECSSAPAPRPDPWVQSTHTFRATQAADCRLRITVRNETATGGHKLVLVSIMVANMPMQVKRGCWHG